MSEQSIIERVARAIHREALVDAEFDELRQCRMRQAHAALKAMRDPLGEVGTASFGLNLVIDAALAEPV